MIAMLVVFDLSGNPEAMRQSDSAGSAKRYLAMPGLIHKTFFKDDGRHQVGGFYVWETEEAMRAYLDADGTGPSRRKFGVEPAITIFDATTLVQGPAFDAARVLVADR